MTQEPNQNRQLEPAKPKNSIRKTVRTVLTVLVVLLLVLAIAIVLTARLRGEPLFIAGYTALWVQTDSMEDTIPAKSFILVEKVSAQDVAVGDVITFVCDDPSLPIYGQPNTHRVVEIVGDHAEFVTKGDHNLAEDHTTAKADKVLARYVRNLTVLSSLGRFFTTPAGLAVALVCIALFCLLLYLPEIRKAVRKKKEAKAKEEAEKQAILDEKIREEVEKLKQNEATGNPPPEDKE
ncbi:MAG: signal peptidase I [Clostridia bacterium]|nr:signal peptidase I [Clostridia bacterium]